MATAQVNDIEIAYDLAGAGDNLVLHLDVGLQQEATLAFEKSSRMRLNSSHAASS